ncbi:hypothetical protein DICVIV_06429 [Dictyocaulus viviparus]|uniref:M protein repeat protein n=1 Tax=Dictyocaulus viviparus TaxID=29172 RepID=A0A0D8XYQ7_DICVI|nr:hypothetical protein DICVIV_06429 [Dictyocaulus viviparus]
MVAGEISSAAYINAVNNADGMKTSIEENVSVLKKMVKEKEEELIALREGNNIKSDKLHLKLSKAEHALKKSEDKIKELLKQVVASEASLSLFRDAHTTKESELMEIMNQCERIQAALKESEESREVVEQRRAERKGLGFAEAKTEFYQQVQTAIERLNNECAVLQEHLNSEHQLSNSEVSREVTQLQQEIHACNEALNEANFALKRAESQFVITEKEQIEYIKHSVTLIKLQQAQGEVTDLREAKLILESEMIVMEQSLRNRVADIEKINTNLKQSQEDLSKVVAEKDILVKKWEQQENNYMEKVVEVDKIRASVKELENTVEMLKSEAHSLNVELIVANEKLRVEIASNEKTVDALTDLEQEYLQLRKQKETSDSELERLKNRYAIEVNKAQQIADDLKEEVTKLQNQLVIEETIANEKLEKMHEKVDQLEVEISKSKAMQVEADMQLTQKDLRCQELIAEKQQLEGRLSDAISRADTMCREPEQKSKDCDDEIKELRRQLELKVREVNRLGVLCDEFDEIEDNYRQKLYALVKERDELKSRLNTPEASDSKATLTERRQSMTRDTLLSRNVADSKTSEVDEDLVVENRELKRRCSVQEQRINDLEKLCDEADECEEKLKNEIAVLHRELDALKKNAVSNDIKTSNDNVNSILSSDNNEAASETTLCKGLESTANLSQSPAMAKGNIGRCAQQ